MEESNCDRSAEIPGQRASFYSAKDEFRKENDEEEHEREIADYYALQRSRRLQERSNLYLLSTKPSLITISTAAGSKISSGCILGGQ